MSYQLYDVDGFIGDFATNTGLAELRDFIDDLEGNENIKEFIDKGASLLTANFISEVNKLKSSNENIQKTIDNFQDLVEKADTIVIINDGLNEEE